MTLHEYYLKAPNPTEWKEIEFFFRMFTRCIDTSSSEVASSKEVVPAYRSDRFPAYSPNGPEEDQDMRFSSDLRKCLKIFCLVDHSFYRDKTLTAILLLGITVFHAEHVESPEYKELAFTASVRLHIMQRRVNMKREASDMVSNRHWRAIARQRAEHVSMRYFHRKHGTGASFRVLPSINWIEAA